MNPTSYRAAPLRYVPSNLPSKDGIFMFSTCKLHRLDSKWQVVQKQKPQTQLVGLYGECLLVSTKIPMLKLDLAPRELNPCLVNTVQPYTSAKH